MTVVPLSTSFAPHRPFAYVGGDPAIDLVNSADWTARGPAEDRLTDFARLVEWSAGTEALAPRMAQRLLDLAADDARAAQGVHRDALRLRWVLRRLFGRVASGEGIAGTAPLAELNQRVSRALGQLELAPPPKRGAPRGSPRPVALWSWRDAGERLDSVLWPVIRSAAELLVSDEADRIRECGGSDCGWLYVDRSRNGFRRWCQMETCGTREKSRQRALRRATQR
jgi:predicted RNA-binding Zn ribbon-like protein